MKILIISPGNISNPHGGATNRMFNLAVNLSKKNDVFVLEPLSKEDPACKFKIYNYFGNIGSRSLSAFCDLNPFFIFRLAKLLLSKKIDIIQVEFPWGVAAAKIMSSFLSKKTLVIYASHNYQAKLQKDLSTFYKNSTTSTLSTKLISSLLGSYTQLTEKIAVVISDYILCVSKEDSIAFNTNYSVNFSKMKIIPNGCTLCPKNRPKMLVGKKNYSIVFHGSYNYPPNKEAVEHIIRYISPQFISNMSIKFIIAGAGVPDNFAASNVTSAGFVENIHSFLMESDVAIVPLTTGGGTKLKLLDYLGCGLPIVTTRKGIEGLDVLDKEHALVVDEVNKEFIESIKYLLNNKEECRRLGLNAYQLAYDKYSWLSIVRDLDEFYNKICEE